MLFTLFYMIATSIQAWRISSLKARLSVLYQQATHTYPSIMLYTKPRVYKSKESNGTDSSVTVDYEIAQNSMTSHLCLNKSLAKLGDLLWCYGDTRLCTIYPQQQLDISEWLVYQRGETLFPLYTINCYETSQLEDHKMHVLVEADLESYSPGTSVVLTKIEEYGLILTWTANKNLCLLLETDLHHFAKLTIAVMQGQCCINNGLMVVRIESVVISGKPCIYDKEQLSPLPEKKLADKSQWGAYVKQLRAFSDIAQLVSQQNMPLEVTDMPGVVIFPKHKAFVVSDDTADDKHSCDSPVLPTPSQTPASTSTIMGDTAFNLSQTAASSVDPASTISQETSNYDSAKSSVSEASKETLDTNEFKQELDGLLEPTSRVVDSAKSSVSEASKGTLDTNEFKQELDGFLEPTSRPLDTPTTIKMPMSERSSITHSKHIKSPNVLVYSDNSSTLNKTKSLLETILATDKYTIYPLSSQDVRSDTWVDEASLVVVCGDVGEQVTIQLVDYVTRGGKLLSLCSDVLHTILPIFKSAELCKQDLIRISYGKWKNVCVAHHAFCYERSSNQSTQVAVLHPPASGEVNDKQGKAHPFDLKILATEDACRAPGIMSISIPSTGGKVVLSQIHLEVNPTEYQKDDFKFSSLKQSDKERLEVFRDLLTTHLGMDLDVVTKEPVTYSPAFFLGRHELKLEMLQSLKDDMQHNGVLKMTHLDMQFCNKSTDVKSVSPSCLPILLHQCPDNFSTIEYFENLKTEEIGRLVIYADTLTSSMYVVSGPPLRHGLAVITRQQTRGQGRRNNTWLSPKGCAMFTLQLHVPASSILGKCIPALQYIVAVALISAVKNVPGYQDIDLNLKWPNDIYVGKSTKLGGILVTTHVTSGFMICNVGVGVNLSNSTPTSCINDAIATFNKDRKTKLEPLSLERYLALVFTELENLLTTVQNDRMDKFLEIYYKYWMHTNAEVTVVSEHGDSENVKIIGIDNFGFLKVKGKAGNVFTVHPDGNSFDFLKGLIIPK